MSEVSEERALRPCGYCGAQVADDEVVMFGETEVCRHCKNEYVQRLKEGVGTAPEDARARTIREEHLSHEASIRGMGLLLYLVGIIAVLTGLLGFSQSGVFGLTSVLLGGVNIWVGALLRRCSPHARIPAVLLAALGLVNVPIGTVLSVYFLYLLLSRKGRTVLSKEYQEIRAATPDIKYRTSRVLLILLLVLLLIVVVVFAGGALTALVMSAER